VYNFLVQRQFCGWVIWILLTFVHELGVASKVGSFVDFVVGSFGFTFVHKLEVANKVGSFVDFVVRLFGRFLLLFMS